MRGGQTTQIHALIDFLGRPGALLLTPGTPAMSPPPPAVLAEAPGRIRRLSADKGYDADGCARTCGHRASRPSSRASAAASNGSATTSAATASAGASSFDRLRMRATFNRLKDFRRTATRYDKLVNKDASALVAIWF